MILLMLMMLMDTSARKFTWVQLTVSCLFGSETLKETHLWLLLDVASAPARNYYAFDAPKTHGGDLGEILMLPPQEATMLPAAAAISIVL